MRLGRPVLLSVVSAAAGLALGASPASAQAAIPDTLVKGAASRLEIPIYDDQVALGLAALRRGDFAEAKRQIAAADARNLPETANFLLLPLLTDLLLATGERQAASDTAHKARLVHDAMIGKAKCPGEARIDALKDQHKPIDDEFAAGGLDYAVGVRICGAFYGKDLKQFAMSQDRVDRYGEQVALVEASVKGAPR